MNDRLDVPPTTSAANDLAILLQVTAEPKIAEAVITFIGWAHAIDARFDETTFVAILQGLVDRLTPGLTFAKMSPHGRRRCILGELSLQRSHYWDKRPRDVIRDELANARLDAILAQITARQGITTG